MDAKPHPYCLCIFFTVLSSQGFITLSTWLTDVLWSFTGLPYQLAIDTCTWTRSVAPHASRSSNNPRVYRTYLTNLIYIFTQLVPEVNNVESQVWSFTGGDSPHDSTDSVWGWMYGWGIIPSTHPSTSTQGQKMEVDKVRALSLTLLCHSPSICHWL